MEAADEAERQAQARPTSAGGEPAWKPQHRRDCDGENCRCPQVKAYESEADVIGFGGSAGGGKTDILLGFAGTKHRRSIIFRREFPRLEGIIARSREIFAQGQSHEEDSFNESLHRWSLNGGERTIQLAAMQYEEDKKNFQGQPRDFIGFDEAPEHTESQVRFITGWNRTTVEGQKCRTVLTFNPPMDQTQEWIIAFFAPWLDEKYSDPAQDGEIRYVVRVDDRDAFFRTIEEIPEETAERLKKLATESYIDDWKTLVKTRTCFHASLSDNPILAATGYASQVESLPEPLRSILKGNFNAGKVANPWQCIPTEWVKAAIERGKGRTRGSGKQTALGVDVARGGKDKFAIAPLYGTWFDPVFRCPGVAVTDGKSGAALVVNVRRDNSPVGIDLVGIGSSVYDTCNELGMITIAFSGGSSTNLKDKNEFLRFGNVRSAAYWLFREALDPNSGLDIILPDDQELLGDLTAPNFKVVTGTIKVESKDDDPKTHEKGLKSRLGRSPDLGDAVIQAWYTYLIYLAYVATGDNQGQVVYDPVRIGY